MKTEVLKEYNVELDKKKRMTIRGDLGFSNYHVIIFRNGNVLMEPQLLISKKTLHMMDTAMENLAKGIVGSAIDFTEFPEILEEE